MRLERWIVVPFVIHAGCVAIKSETKLVEYPEGTRHVDRVVAGSRTYDASAAVAGEQLLITLSTKQTCEEADVPIVRRKRVITRSEVPSHFGITEEFVTGIGGMALGGLLLVNPERACTSTDQTGAASRTDPQTCTNLGWAAVGIGAAITAVAVIDSVRARDAEQDLGTHEGAYDASKHECHLEPVANAAVELRLGDGAIRLRDKTSGNGELTFSLLDVQEDALPSPEAPATLSVENELVALPVTDKLRRELSASLKSNPRSRISHDISDIAQKRCDRAVDDAQQVHISPDAGDGAIAKARDAWEHAKAVCSARWTADLQRTQAAAEQAITENRIGAIVLALNLGDLDRVDDVLANNQGVAASLRDDPGVLQLLRKTVGEPTRALVSGKNAIDAQRRLCRARQLFVTIRGTSRWDQFKVEVAQNVTELAGGVPANVVRLMDAARCE